MIHLHWSWQLRNAAELVAPPFVRGFSVCNHNVPVRQLTIRPERTDCPDCKDKVAEAKATAAEAANRPRIKPIERKGKRR